MLRCLFLLALVLFGATAHAQWKYETDKDEMTGKSTITAMIQSSNSLALPFPYSGENPGRLTVRKHPSYGLDVIFEVAKGQIQCSSYSGCSLKVKFDDAAPITLNGTPAADHSPNLVFFQNNKLFLQKATKAKRILVQATFFHGGAPVLTFDAPTPLVWPPKKP